MDGQLASGQQQRQSRVTFSKKDEFRNFIIEVLGFNGINQTVAPNLISDNDCQEIWNYLPISRGVVRKIKAPEVLYEFEGTYPVKMYSAVIAQGFVRLIFTADGAVYLMDSSGNVTSISVAGTLSGNPLYTNCITWGATTVYVIDSKGYFKYDGSTFSQVSSSLKGNWITVWQGRVFIATDNLLQYSAALDPETWTGPGTGYIDIRQSFPSLKNRITAVVSYIDSLLIYGDSATFMLTGSTISNDPSQWYLTEVNNTIGVRATNSVVAYSQNHYFYNEKGMYVATASQSQKFDYKIDLSMVNIQDLPAAVSEINNLIFYLVPVSGTTIFTGNLGRNFILAFCVDLGQFFFLDINDDVSGLYKSASVQDDHLYIFSKSGKLYRWGTANTSIWSRIVTKQYDLEALYLQKIWMFLYLSVRILYGDAQLGLRMTNDITILPQRNIEISRSIFGWQGSDDYVYWFTDASQLDLFWFASTNQPFVVSTATNLFAPGLYCALIIDESTNAVFDLVNFTLKGQMSYSVI